jgi:hypothetical protein
MAPLPDADVSLMKIARLQAPLRAGDMVWTRVEPRRNLVHVVVDAPVITGTGLLPVSLVDIPRQDEAPPVLASRKPLGDLRREFGPAREAPYEAGPLRPMSSRSEVTSGSPSGSESAFPKISPAPRQPAAAASDEKNKRLVKRVEKQEPDLEISASSSGPARRAAPASKPEAKDSAVQKNPERSGVPPPETRLGGPAPQRKLQGPSTSEGATGGLTGSAPKKWDGRKDMMETNKGI